MNIFYLEQAIWKLEIKKSNVIINIAKLLRGPGRTFKKLKKAKYSY